MVSSTEHLLNEVRDRIAPADHVLAEARKRRDCVLRAAASFDGALRTYRSGSVATGLANKPVSDADGGMVLDRRTHLDLGPEGDNELPFDIVDKLHAHIRPVIREAYPDLSLRKMKRGLLAEFNAPFASGEDPSVDLVIALTRREGSGLWIPNLDQNRWDPSDPERHVALLLTGDAGLRRIRARVTRLAKAWNHAVTNSPLCSFNIVALAFELVTETDTLEVALHKFFAAAHVALSAGLTQDPAGVSAPIKLPIARSVALSAIADARDTLGRAIEYDADPDAVGACVAALFPEQLTDDAATKIAWAHNFRGQSVGVGVGGALAVAHAAPFKAVRSWGGQ